MLKIKIYFLLTLFIVLVSSITTAAIGIKVAKHRGEKIDELSKQLNEISNRTEKYDVILTDYLEKRNENRKIYTDLKKDLDGCSDDVFLPDEFNRLWEKFTTSQTCRASSVDDTL